MVASMICLLTVTVLFCATCTTLAIQCRDESNQGVDWFYAYKLPKKKHHSQLLNDGMAYVYMTSDDHADWKFSNISINSTESIIGNTLRYLYEGNVQTGLSYVLYNDQPPHHTSDENKGHNKGVILLEEDGGFWLVHSVPHFPDIKYENYVFPRTGTVYGQSFLCISMKLNELNMVGLQLKYNEPFIYSTDILERLKTAVPNLAAAASNKTVTNPPWFHVTNISSKLHVQFVSFAKSKEFDKDLYEDLVAPYLQSNMLVETWPDGPGRLKSNCSKTYKVKNITSMLINVTKVDFSTTEDHSKWTVSNDQESWICVGDINRAESQKSRGGGTVCLNNKTVAKNYKKGVQSIEECL